MANITAAEVNKLRQATGAGMMDCKQALVEAEGDFDKAIEILRKKGQKVAAKRADRDSSEGAVIAKVSADSKKGAIVSLNCETDFVAKNESFVALAKDLAELALNLNSKDELLAANYNGITVAEKLTEQTGVIGEKIEIGAFEKLEAPFVGSYIHHGNKIAALVGLSAANAEVAKNVAMQVAAMGAEVLSYKEFDAAYVAKETEARIAAIIKDNEELARLGNPLKHVPEYVSYAQLTPEVLAKAEAAIKEELKAEGKPEKIFDKIVPGKLQRYIADNTTLDQEKALLDQVYISDESKKVSEYVAANGVEVVGFKRVAL
ncbi:elongation factor Ts [Capnocytophaga haemolytica]|jgi:translation elongation factor Ts|uniref:Elongation factor Ts n=1 Tax=Capnocytophaga haemolytica TaxID=45243 RepID=A0AAX2H0N5_9FLAO|nr:translation elongation factor Ts [Capnocytophaga haemolytica]AMD85805.1 elongation factor Ts [Capnocytophaga haemolytica]SFN81734.1 elongation factor Ts [Capnocytophaga haemolytica]SNV15799.1 Elongation factor Ts [Capnocytophaga haemolytica]